MPKGYKTGGRQKGTPNKATSDLRLVLKALVNESLMPPNFINELTAKEKADLLVRLLPYVVPRYADIQPEPPDQAFTPVIINWTPPETE